MANREELEIQDWQREPGLKNPLTPEQIEWLQAQALMEFAGAYCPAVQAIQAVAERYLPQKLMLSGLLNLILDDF
ncbi:MAG: hypothetical protein LBS10_10655 [Gracilibacteraceae bacterium]|jgi:hypothetical protein|nr:hypothetical protein [Gracilibacteraceae bacterium]